MRFFALFIVFLLTQNFLAQNIKIEYRNSRYQSDGNGIYDNQEIIKIYPEKNNYKLEFTQLKKFYIYNDSTKKDTRLSINEINTTKRNLKSSLVDNLISELGQNKNNFDYELIRKQIKSSISKQDIIKLIKVNNIFYKIGDEQTKKIDKSGKQKIKDIKEFKLFDRYIESIKPSDSIITVYSHGLNSAIISYQNEKYILNFLNPLGQPIDGKKLFVNLEVNTALNKILPEKSLLRKNLTADSLLDKYIYWYLDNYYKY
ncbi:hypothetical protein LPB85_08735 [Chryseobacterium sp. LC2016-27]|uniref:hypothetical protein n=1 Tax=Chryseobacterium sp. LC2016-27 TaxID=2897326 RepID=UPI001E38688E|nr:hypothetical protein [Chryseobacterium sp. LC2016-27]MCD0455534.1 hypothetical protein [Chryseobacterium sp. LC2016-27]